MNASISIAKRELKSYFESPVAYVFLVVFLMLFALLGSVLAGVLLTVVRSSSLW